MPNLYTEVLQYSLQSTFASSIETWKSLSFKIDTIGSEDQVLTATQGFVIVFPC